MARTITLELADDGSVTIKKDVTATAPKAEVVFKVGDIVYYKGPTTDRIEVNAVGRVVCVDDENWRVGVEFIFPVQWGHDFHGQAKEGHGQYFYRRGEGIFVDETLENLVKAFE